VLGEQIVIGVVDACDLPGGVDAIGLCFRRSGKIEGLKSAVSSAQEALIIVIGREVISGDLTCRVDAGGNGGDRARRIEGGVNRFFPLGARLSARLQIISRHIVHSILRRTR
jgi:hypothetical protein